MAEGTERLGSISGVDLWRVLLDVDRRVAPASILSAAELARAERFAFEADRRRFVAARAAVRVILAGYVGAEPATLSLVEGEGRKPALVGGPRFNLSHSEGLAVCAVAAAREVGVDVERLRPVPEAEEIAARFFTESERGAWMAERTVDPDGAFLRCWTRKEAWLKALGVGLATEAAPPFDGARWSRHDIDLGPGWAGALVVERARGEGRLSP